MTRLVCEECGLLLCGEGGVDWFCDNLGCCSCHNPECSKFTLPQMIPKAFLDNPKWLQIIISKKENLSTW